MVKLELAIANYSIDNSNWHAFEQNAEAVVWRCSVKKLFLEFSQNSQENTCARVSLLIRDSGTGAFL